MITLLEKDGILVNEVEINDPSTGSHFKVVLTSEQIIVRILKNGSVKPSIPIRFLLPGENRLNTAGGVRLLLQFPDGPFLLQDSIPFVGAHSLKLWVFTAFNNINGDLAEEYAVLKSKHGVIKAQVWYWKQILISVCPVFYEAVRRSIAFKSKI